MDYIKQIFAKRTKAARLAKGLTVKELAEKLRVSEKTVSRWEAHGLSRGMEILINLSVILEVSADYLLGRTSDP